ncbi:BTAD domain-containing putative transcriptional regulator [Mycolicibacterium sp. HK-90]|uniref:BTAD domain-containing putative transcriptional regulator n=1 Tax=Mycolicibacterium sp. HK-90 TaxID=3056937 RepID=UPI002658335E|nr:BTAD domain-containing putative transcriptional regulator [Mycolicibacterium sp. HK-90]WKG04227.1 BTAD domain-containing putative transcriptional regulator [Mycolicibacterium sp. HK-90]
MELGVLGPLQVRMDGAPVAVPGAKPRAILTMLGLHSGSVVPADVLMELLWGDDPPRTAAKALQTHISSLRHTLGDGFVLTEGTGWRLSSTGVDTSGYRAAARSGRDALDAGDAGRAVTLFDEALTLWRGIPELPDSRRGASETTRWIEDHASLVEDRADALLATGRAAEIVGELEAAVGDAPLRERRWGQLMLALYRAGRQGEALGAFKRVQAVLSDELGVDPGPDLRRLEAAIVAQDAALEIPAVQHVPAAMRAVTFLLTDIEGSTAAWEADADAMALALARHDELIEQVVTSRGGRLIKTRGEGDATFSVFERPSAAAAAALELQDAILHEPWDLQSPMRIRIALHTGEAELRDGDYFGRAVNRAARLRSLAAGGQTLCSGATAELVVDSLRDDVVLADLGMRRLKNLARPEHVFELRFDAEGQPEPPVADEATERPALPTVLAGPGPFVGRSQELGQLSASWQIALTDGARAALIAGEPGVGKTRLAGEWSRQAYAQGAVVLYGRSDEDLGAPYQPFAEALRTLVPCVGTSQLRGVRGIEALLPLVPGLTDVLPDLAAPPRADPDTERYALFDAVVALLGAASTEVPIVLVLDDLHWAAKPTLLLLRHLLRFGEHARVQIIGTYRSTDLDRSHPLAAMLADLHRDGSADRIALSGLDEDDVTTYVAQAGYDDEELARALASVTGGNPFFLIEALRHVEESGGHWDPSTLPQGVREAVSRRLSRLPAETNKALAAAAVVGSRFALDLVERVVDQDLVDSFEEACQAGILIEEPGGRYRFNHAIVRQSLLAELASVRRMRLHQRIATTLENEPGADDELLAELAHHYFECAWAGNALKAVEYCRRAADQAMSRLAYEGAADLYDHALHALEEVDDELPDLEDQRTQLLVARCEALLAAGDVSSAAGAVAQLKAETHDSARLAAWATCFEGQLSMLIDPERLDEIESAVDAAAGTLAEFDDAAGEAKAHTVRAGCLARLGRIGDCEVALDNALTAARRAREHRRVNAVLAGAPLAALWGPNPVPRAGGRCLDVVRLLRITTDSPAVEATSTRCQAVLEAFRGRAAAARRMIDSARRTVTELGLRHALLEVEHFAGIVELVVDDPAAAERHLRVAYNGFRRMGIDADAAETAALLGRACLLLGRDVEAGELCAESERLAGHALKASIAWRTVRAQLLSRGGDHDEARTVAQEAVVIAERTDALIDHGDACLALATVLDAAGDATGARTAAGRAVELYERKGALTLAEKARRIVDVTHLEPAMAPEATGIEVDNACVRSGRRFLAAMNRRAWDEVEQLFAPEVTIESRRKIVGFARKDLTPQQWLDAMAHFLETGMVRHDPTFLAVRGEHLALIRLEIGTADQSPGAPRDELLQVTGIDDDGRIATQVWFDTEDIDAALAELDSLHARRLEAEARPPLANAATRADDQLVAFFNADRLDEVGALFTEGTRLDDRRQGFRRESNDRAAAVDNIRAIASFGPTVTNSTVAVRGDLLCLRHIRFEDASAFCAEALELTEVDTHGLMLAKVVFDLDDFDAAFEELDARYLAGAAAPYAQTWSAITRSYAGFNRHELAATTPDWVNLDHRRGAAFASGDMVAYIQAAWADSPDTKIHITAVHRMNYLGAVVTHAAQGISNDGFDAEWRDVHVLTVEGDVVSRSELFDEANLDAALERFDELSRPVPRHENAATRLYRDILASFRNHDWDNIRELLAEDISTEDRRHVVNSGRRQGRDAVIAEMSAIAEVGVTDVQTEVIASRGSYLALSRSRASTAAQQPDAFHSDLLEIIEVNGDSKALARVVFDPDDFDAALAELDARYLAGEAAPYANTWSAICRISDAFNHRKEPATTPNWANIDHRQATAFATGEMTEYLSATWNLSRQASLFIETVHELNTLGAVITQSAQAVSHEGFHAEWRVIILLTVDGDLISRCEVFDETDCDAALTRFDELSRQSPQLANIASRAHDRFMAYFTARDWAAIAGLLMDNAYTDDRRRVVNTGIRRGRDAVLTEIKALADIGGQRLTSEVIAIRGERLALRRTHFSGSDDREAYHVGGLEVIEAAVDERLLARIAFDLDDFDAALAELDARYLAGEAAPYARTWSAFMRGYAAANSQELRGMTSDWVNIDHRRARAFAPGEMSVYMDATWDLAPGTRIYVENVHCLNDLGAVVTHVANGTSQQGFDAQWREINVSTVEGDLANRSELYDETDLDAALARFDELQPRTPRLENTASLVEARCEECLSSGNLEALSELMADDISIDDRRRVTNAGLRHGREAVIEDLRVGAEIGLTQITPTAIATRGEHLTLRRIRYSGGAQSDDTFLIDLVQIVEIDADEHIHALVLFDPDDLDDALTELDARYLAGEGAPYVHTWSVVISGYAAFNRQELPPTTPDWVNIDHRRARAFAPGDLIPYIRATWDITPHATVYVEAVHRLNEFGTVVGQVTRGTSNEGFDAEWREYVLFTTDGDLLSRAEVFDEADFDVALARFDELTSSNRTPQLENAASRVAARFGVHFVARDWGALAEILAEDVFDDDRRRVVNAGTLRGRGDVIADASRIADVGAENITAEVIATRGARLVLSRVRYSGSDAQQATFHVDALDIVQIDADERLSAHVAFDPEDIDAAFEELDARYLAGEAAACAHTWSVITNSYLALNRHELPAATTNWTDVDRRQVIPVEAGALGPSLRAIWDLTTQATIYIEAAHQLTDAGAVLTHVASATSRDGLDAEWRNICILIIEDDRLSHGEVFDESDLDAALARFDELSRQTPT